MKVVDSRPRSPSVTKLRDIKANECFRINDDEDENVWLRSGGYKITSVDHLHVRQYHCIMVMDGVGGSLEGMHSMISELRDVTGVPATLTLGEE